MGKTKPMFPPKPSDIFPPEGGRSEGLDALRFFLENKVGSKKYGTVSVGLDITNQRPENVFDISTARTGERNPERNPGVLGIRLVYVQ